MSVRYRVLGPVEITATGRPVALAGQPLTLLACLLVRANTILSVATLADVLWPGGVDAPANPRGTIQTYVTRLRRALGPDMVQTAGGGYRMNVGAAELDLLKFQALADQGDLATAAGDDATATARFDEALALWRGPALQDVRSEVLHRDDVSSLVEQRLGVWERWAEGQLRLGELPIEQLQRLTRENPLRERLWEQLMLVLYRAGRQADALAAYRQVSAILADELGLDPGPALQRLQQRVLTGDPELQAVPQRTVPRPRQLSAVAEGFTGRVDELARLAKLLDENAATVVVDGAGGVGKTTLALRFAHELADRFPDGQVQLNLHGYGPGDPVEPLAALGTLLQAVDVPSEQVPASAEARSALWRTHTAGRAILVLLDNARNSEQVRPLLPGPGCLVIVTSRSQLSGLVARDGAARVSVGRLPEADALALLAATVGAERVHVDEAGQRFVDDAARRFVEVCARLPLAIRILGQHANQQPDRPLSDLLDEISSDPLASFDLDDGAETNLRDLFARSYAALDDDAARLFRLLGRHPGSTFGVAAAAALAGLPIAQARRLLGRLVGANLLEQPRPGRYEFHDLLREFAVEQTAADDDAAVARVLDWYVHAALRASRAIRPGWADEVPEPVGMQLPDFAGYRDGVDWYGNEHDNLIAAFTVAAGRQLDQHVCRLAMCLSTYFNAVSRRDNWIAMCERALRSARAIGDQHAEGRLLNSLGIATARFGSAEQARSYCQAGLAVARVSGRLDDEFAALNNLAIACFYGSDMDASIEAAREALAVAERLDDPQLVTMGHNNLSDLYIRTGRLDEAATHAEQALAMAEALTDVWNRGYTTLNLANIRTAMGDHRSAIEHYRAALDAFRTAGDVLAASEAMEELGDLHRDIGDAHEARRCYAEAHSQLIELGHRDAERVRGKLADLAATTRSRP